MQWKKYAILLPPFFLIGLLLLIGGKIIYAFLAVLLFWVVYYIWSFLEKKKEGLHRNGKL